MTDAKEDEPIIELTHVVEEDKRNAPVFPQFQSEVKGIKAALQAEAERWMVVEGAKILERVAREMFPKIAVEILREEILRLRTEAEEKQ